MQVRRSKRRNVVEIAAYWIALVTVVTVPPSLLVWFIVHPLTPQWRKVGPLVTYLTVLAIVVPLMALVYRLRALLMRVHFGVGWPLIAGALVLFGCACCIAVLRRRRLTPAIMFGLPQLLGRACDGALITDGIYAHVRHPRYVEVALSLAAIALFTGYLTVYMVAALCVPVIYLVVLLEERELRERFGVEYEEYCRRVPRFVPRLRARRKSRP
jgi:protein-S-isoprenylcysteine O-methyltransferase Ste14